MSPRTVFEEELKKLTIKVEEMAIMVESDYAKLFQIIENQQKIDVAEFMEKGRAVTDLERNVESKCLSLITKQQPVARDLRVVSSSLKVVTDIERVGDHIVDIAELAVRLESEDILNFSSHVKPMVMETRKMLRLSIDAFVQRDQRKAQEVIDRDDVVDNLFNHIKTDVTDYLKSGERPIDECVDMIMIAKYLEKIADHAVNIGQWEIFKETGDLEDTRVL